MTPKGRLYADLAAHHGELTIHNIDQTLDPKTVWPEWDFGSAVQHAVEAWHFASRLTPEEMCAVLNGEVPRITWTPARMPGAQEMTELL